MCDRCGVIFAEGAEGSSITNGTKNVRNERSGRMEQQQVSMDACPDCTAGVTVAPRLALLPLPQLDASATLDRYEAYRAGRTPTPPTRPQPDPVTGEEDDEDPRAWTDTIPPPGY